MADSGSDSDRNGKGARSDVDPAETREWVDAVDAVIEADGPDRAEHLLSQAIGHAHRRGAAIETSGPTPYINTIHHTEQPELPGDPSLERRVRSLVRWNAIAMILRANAESSELGGHIASYQSAALLYEIGFNHFWHAPSDEHGGDLVYIQGHSSPGIYARSFLEGRLTEENLDGFRQEVSREGGLSSYPHPWLMPEYWQFPTVSMGLGPIMAIHQAYFMRYLEDRGIAETSGRKVWAFLGDGETDEPESLGEIALAGREGLDNLVFVVNCNLQRLDGPVHGNGKIIQVLETVFRGAGWNVIKVIWGDRWDPLLEEDDDGLLIARMEEAIDGEYQVYKSRDGAYVREHFFGEHPELAKRVEDMSDEEIWNLNRGGHDAGKVYAAYKAAHEHKGQPTVILAKTIKGYGMGEAGEGQNVTHQQKKMNTEALKAFRDRFDLEISDEEIEQVAFYRPDEDSPELTYMRERREALGGYLPARRTKVDEPLPVPDLELFKSQLEGSGEREVSTTMAFVRVLAALLRDKKIGDRIVPIVPDESRTFGMEGMFRQLGIYSHVGQLYEPEDAGSMMFYKEDQQGQILQEGINEAGAMSAWIAAATSYSNHDTQMIPFYVFYSMFGFQRIGDLAWAAGDSRARGFLLGGTAGRTTLNGEGLQHEDGHSHVLSATIPNCISYDPAYGHEIAVIVQDGLRRMIGEQEDVFYYLTIANENYPHPALPEGSEEGILRGMHIVRKPDGRKKAKVRLLGSGPILREALGAADLLAEDFDIEAEVWSVTSWTELRRDGLAADREVRLHASGDRRETWVEKCLGTEPGTPVVATSDYMKALPDGIRPWVHGRFAVLGTDGYGRSDWRRELRDFFEIDRRHVAVAALQALADDGKGPRSAVKGAIERYEINPDKPDPAYS
jgi:pyruvate dehydrogenase E1 component